jgi:hypothetical protein
LRPPSACIGFQALEAVFAAVGVTVVGLAWRTPRTQLPVLPALAASCGESEED